MSSIPFLINDPQQEQTSQHEQRQSHFAQMQSSSNDLLARLSSFLPEMASANTTLLAKIQAEGPQSACIDESFIEVTSTQEDEGGPLVVDCDDSSSSSSTTSSSDSSGQTNGRVQGDASGQHIEMVP